MDGISVMPFVSYKLSGTYKINTAIYLKDMSDINRRAAIIMACHLFHGTSNSCWKVFRGYIAAGIFKRMSTEMHAMHVRNEVLQTTLPNWHLMLDSNCYIVDNEHRASNWTGSETFTSTVGGCLEMVVANRFIVVVSYAIEICCDTSQTKNIDGYSVMPEPHHSWTELIDDVDKIHDTRRQFSSTIADRAISTSPRYSPIAYVQHKDKLTRHFFAFN